jgi:hypothetical protein
MAKEKDGVLFPSSPSSLSRIDHWRRAIGIVMPITGGVRGGFRSRIEIIRNQNLSCRVIKAIRIPPII